MSWRPACLAVLASLLAARGSCEGRPFAVGPPPSWVEPVDAAPAERTPVAQVADGIYYRLLDSQVRVGDSGSDEYRRVVREIVNEAGLQSASQIKVEFDPSYQTVTLHGVRVRRGGRVLERLDPTQVKVLQRERDLEAQMYDGSLSLLVFLEDLRVGDVVDHAFTIRGSNPVYQGRYHGAFWLEWSIPVHRSRVRLLFPAGRPIVARSQGTSLGPLVRRLGAWRELVFESLDAPVVSADPRTPDDYVTWGWVQLSEWSSWREVAEWGARLFVFPAAPPAALQAQLGRWRALGPAAALQAALRFVQDEVRYLAIELGASSHRPHAPEQVAARRFGDCKDKVLLFCTLARSLGAACTPALVSTVEGRRLDDWLPSPAAFDHAVARVVLGGQVFWVDPTLAAQGGPPGGSSFPNYQRALLLAPGVDALSVIPPQARPTPSRVVHERFTAKHVTEPAGFTVETRFLGPEADDIRYELRRSSREDVARGWLEYYAKTWPRIQATAPVTVADDREKNLVVTREYYRIPDFWAPIEEAPGRRQLDLSAQTLAPYLRKPPTTPRSAPVQLAYPVSVRHLMEVELPDDLEVDTSSYDWQSPELRFHYRSTWKKGRFLAEYELETLRDRVTLARLPTHSRSVDALSSYLDWHFEYPPRRPRRLGGGPNWPVLAVAGLVGLVGIAAAAFSLSHLTRTAASWRVRGLALVAVAGAATLLVLGLVRSLPLYSSTAWVAETTAGHQQYRAAWAPVLLSVLAARILLLAACLLLAASLAASRRFRGLLGATLLTVVALCFAEGISYVHLAGARSLYATGAGRDALMALLPLFLALPAALFTPSGPPRR